MDVGQKVIEVHLDPDPTEGRVALVVGLLAAPGATATSRTHEEDATQLDHCGTEPSAAKCVEQEVRAWRFPAHDCGVRQPVTFSLHFTRP